MNASLRSSLRLVVPVAAVFVLLPVLSASWNIWDPMGSLLDWILDGAVKGWRAMASLALTKSALTGSEWGVANVTLGRVAGVCAFGAVGAGAWQIGRDMFAGRAGDVLVDLARTALAWPLTVLTITLVVRGVSIADSLTGTILGTFDGGGVDAGLPDINAEIARKSLAGPMLVVMAALLVLGTVVLMLTMGARNFLLILGVALIAVPVMLQGMRSLRPLLSTWARWIVGIILIQPLIALMVWLTSELIRSGSSEMGLITATVGSILAAVFPWTLVSKIAQWMPGTEGLHAAADAARATVGKAAAGAAIAAGVSLDAAAGGMAQATDALKKDAASSASGAGGPGVSQAAAGATPSSSPDDAPGAEGPGDAPVADESQPDASAGEGSMRDSTGAPGKDAASRAMRARAAGQRRGDALRSLGANTPGRLGVLMGKAGDVAQASGALKAAKLEAGLDSRPGDAPDGGNAMPAEDAGRAPDGNPMDGAAAGAQSEERDAHSAGAPAGGAPTGATGSDEAKTGAADDTAAGGAAQAGVDQASDALRRSSRDEARNAETDAVDPASGIGGILDAAANGEGAASPVSDAPVGTPSAGGGTTGSPAGSDAGNALRRESSLSDAGPLPSSTDGSAPSGGVPRPGGTSGTMSSDPSDAIPVRFGQAEGSGTASVPASPRVDDPSMPNPVPGPAAGPGPVGGGDAGAGAASVSSAVRPMVPDIGSVTSSAPGIPSDAGPSMSFGGTVTGAGSTPVSSPAGPAGGAGGSSVPVSGPGVTVRSAPSSGPADAAVAAPSPVSSGPSRSSNGTASFAPTPVAAAPRLGAGAVGPAGVGPSTVGSGAGVPRTGVDGPTGVRGDGSARDGHGVDGDRPRVDRVDSPADPFDARDRRGGAPLL